MKQTIALLACILLSVAATAQTTTNGALRQSSVVVTNETDTLAMQQLNSYTGRISTAWQNPASATNWTWVVNPDGLSVTLTSYNFASLDVVIPDMLDGLNVTGFGSIFSPSENGSAITSVSGGNNIKSIGSAAFSYCTNLTSVIFQNATSVQDYAFYGCRSLTIVTLPRVFEFPFSGSFTGCSSLTSISLPFATTIGSGMFNLCTSLTSVYWGQNQPPEVSTYFNGIAENQVTNYVTSSTATGWGSTFSGMPVVRMPLSGDLTGNVTGNATTATELSAGADRDRLDSAAVLTNGVTEGYGVWTNGVDYGHYYSRGGTNFWELWK